MLSKVRAFIASIERKVKAAGLLTFGAALVLAWLNAVQANSALLPPLSPTVQFVVVASLPPLITLVGAYITAHTPRPELGDEGHPDVA